MSDNLATQSLGHNKLSLWERRQQYEQWLASGRRADRPMGVRARTDEGPSVPNLAAKRAAAEADAASRLITPLPPGAIVRIDEGEDKPDISDDVRLGFAKSLLTKLDGADPETAQRITKAATDMFGPLAARVDDAKKDEDLKNRVIGQGPVKKGSSPGAATAADEDDELDEKKRKAPDNDGKDPVKPEPTLREVMDALKGVSKRLDNLEKKDDDDDDDADGSEGQPTDGPPRGPEDGTSRALAADASKESFKWRRKMDRLGEILCRPDTADVFSVVQARADKVYGYHGQQADKPLYGETLNAYRRRLLNPFLQFSPAFRHSGRSSRFQGSRGHYSC
jgi:hypothetical protein